MIFNTIAVIITATTMIIIIMFVTTFETILIT